MAGTRPPAGSGDLLADRRYAYAEAAFGEDDFEVAADLAHQVLELAPGFAAAWFLLAKAREAQFRALPSGAEASRLLRDAVAAYQSTLPLDEADVLGARVRLAALGIGDPVDAMSAGYVRTLFDDYAIRFDRHLVQGLKYRGPDLLHDAVRRACSLRLRAFRFGQALDLGCGTGLVAELFRPECRSLHGIDLSPVMVERARRKKLYDELAVGDLVVWLAGRADGAADLVVAADVFVYLGDLGAAFRGTARALAPGGLFAFTAQAHDGDGVILGADLRYAHGERHLRQLASDRGLKIVLLEPVSTRQDRGEAVSGWLVVLER